MQFERVQHRDDWNDFVKQNNGPVFNRWEWGDLCEHYGHDRYYLAAKDEGRIVAGVPLIHMKSRIFGNRLISMPYAEYGSLVLADDAPSEAQSGLLEQVKKLADDLKIDFVSLRGNELGDVEGLEHKQRFVTFETSLSSDPQEVWEAFDSRRRTHIRNAKKNGVTFREAQTSDDLQTYYDLYLDNMKGHGSPPHSFEFFTKLWEDFVQQGDLKVLFAEKGGHVINGMMCFPCGNMVYDWGDVSDYEYRDLDGGSFLLWKAMEWACENGFDRYSLGRTREGTGVYMFKKTFGGEKTWLHDYHYFPNGETKLPNPDDESYDQLKNIWQKLPVKVTETVGPRIREKISL